MYKVITKKKWEKMKKRAGFGGDTPSDDPEPSNNSSSAPQTTGGLATGSGPSTNTNPRPGRATRARRRLAGVFSKSRANADALLGDSPAPPRGETEETTNQEGDNEGRNHGNQHEHSGDRGDRHNPSTSTQDEEILENEGHDNGEGLSNVSQRRSSTSDPGLQMQKSMYDKSATSSSKTSTKVILGSKEASSASSSTPSGTGEEMRPEETV
jgi:hypothetical protein